MSLISIIFFSTSICLYFHRGSIKESILKKYQKECSRIVHLYIQKYLLKNNYCQTLPYTPRKTAMNENVKSLLSWSLDLVR